MIENWRQAEKNEKSRQIMAERRDFLTRVMVTKDGARLLEELIRMTRGSAFDPNPIQMAYNTGKMEAVRNLVLDFRLADPTLYHSIEANLDRSITNGR
jgi:hypothetical protein